MTLNRSLEQRPDGPAEGTSGETRRKRAIWTAARLNKAIRRSFKVFLNQEGTARRRSTCESRNAGD